MKNQKQFFYILLLIALIGLSACTNGNPPMNVSETTLELTAIPSDTPSPDTTTPEATATSPLIVPSPSETPSEPLTLSLYSANREIGRCSLGFYASGYQEEYQLLADGRPFACHVDPAFPDRIFCYGEDFPTDTEFPVQVYEPGSNQLLFETYVYLPLEIFFPTLPAPDPSTWCPLRGQNVTCESETVWSREPRPCFASTCYDACGYYYSIDTCVPGT